ncbi:MAG TPA: ABC transporter ATP-binding protein [Chloroflexi bacterium]|nr:ABC transporter ATP-binding protein [Chloroflexota bacterium]
MANREFPVAGEHRYDRSSPVRWILSHALRYPWLPLAAIAASISANALTSYSRVLVGDAFRVVTTPGGTLQGLLSVAVLVGAARAGQALLQLARNVAVEFLAQRIERDTRDEFYISLLGKSLSFHSRQRVGDLMARATNDVHQINLMVNPGANLIFDSLVGTVVPIIAIASIRLQLVAVPLLFVALLAVTLRDYTSKLNPVSDAMRQQFGIMNAGLAESIAGIEVVKAYAQEKQEQQKFEREARRFRDHFVAQGEIRARYLPFLVYAFATAGALLHALLLHFSDPTFDVGNIISFMGLVALLRFPTFLSLFSFNLVQLGISGAQRILELITTGSEMDENADGLHKRMVGEVEFQNVTFGYDDNEPVLRDISFRARPGETVAIVGGTGSGKTTLTRLINRVYDVDSGRVLVDGIDVRDWSLESLRSQISTIEQDVFLFSRPIGENIAFGTGMRAEQEAIEYSAREAQAHGFIESLPEGYDTSIGERGVTLSGGQRQRIAIARAFLTDPRILILDDSTSAIDSATEDAIQKAMYRVRQGRTTFLITHRLSQIRWADRILVLRSGVLEDQGTHEELVQRSPTYRRIFALAEPETAPMAGDGTADDGRRG